MNGGAIGVLWGVAFQLNKKLNHSHWAPIIFLFHIYVHAIIHNGYILFFLVFHLLWFFIFFLLLCFCWWNACNGFPSLPLLRAFVIGVSLIGFLFSLIFQLLFVVLFAMVLFFFSFLYMFVVLFMMAFCSLPSFMCLLMALFMMK